MSYQSFKNSVHGPIDFDHVYGYQCVDLILQYAYSYGVTGIWGNAIDYRFATSPNTKNLTNAFSWIQTADAQVGDIAVLRTNGTNPGDFSGYGHIGIVDSVDGSNIRMFEQNGATGNGAGKGNDAPSVWRSIPKSRIIGVWRPKAAAPPAPAPIPPSERSVFLPSAAGTWRLYYIGSGLRPNTGDQKAMLAPGQFPPGLTYKIEAWVGDYAVVITTQMFGRGVVWVKDTIAQIK